MTRTLYERHKWLQAIRPGDVLVTPSGDFRAVLQATHYKKKRGVSISLAIRKCSWTHRGYTVLDTASIIGRGFRPTGRRVNVNGRKYRQLLRDVRHPQQPPVVSCCDVEGLI